MIIVTCRFYPPALNVAAVAGAGWSLVLRHIAHGAGVYCGYDQRGKSIERTGLMGAAMSLGMIFGPLIGGVLTGIPVPAGLAPFRQYEADPESGAMAAEERLLPAEKTAQPLDLD
jgi:MFS family permease